MLDLKKLLQQIGRTQEDQASILGIDRSHISHLQSGRRTLTPKLAATIAGLTDSEIKIDGKGKIFLVRAAKKGVK